MIVLTKILAFSVALILIFAGVTYVLPQMKGEAPEEKEVDVGALTMDSFTAMGEELYGGKGTCTLCHNKLGRAPDLLAFDVAKVALERIADSRYQGEVKDAEGYLRESMVRPSMYVVEGFGKKGSNDTESPMPAIDKPPIQLSDVEISAVIAYLQNKDGNPVTVALPVKAGAPTAQGKDERRPANPVLAKSPQDAIVKFGCAACHSILETESPIGPNLNDVGERLSIGQIRQSIIAPKAVIAEGYPPIMPDFPAMTITELEMIVRFLAAQTDTQS
ncbi:MAG: cytochrome c [Gammaproteobacteria bacterium]|jgi:mono/diheme cytochrome c family protein|nr:cytochrome c [Gammaproteobacteria bacterium]